MGCNTTEIVRQYGLDSCFFILRRNGDYLRELVYWRIKNIVDELVGMYLSEQIGCEGETDSYLSGFVEVERMVRDINTCNTNTILGIHCGPGLLKTVIATEIDLDFPALQLNHRGCWTFLPNEIHCHLDEIPNLCELNNSIKLGLLELRNRLERYNKLELSELCNRLDQI